MDEAERFRLLLLLGRIQQLSNDHWHAFTRPRQAMGDHAWVGGVAAKSFERRLERSDAELHAQIRKALDLVQQKIGRPLAG
ncbi:hypothetical protein SMC26_36660 [Actinomadura fulvescens]|uniref:Uncharacterized protein n=1 Tax=Actinomadura fulvescens TaxID=46160 RepID=A0ABN3QEF3_9ACTN